MRFVSLFAGIGGMDLGFERAGMECVAQVEIDPYCRRVLAKHWPNVERFEDVREVGAHNLPRCDLVCGGFPCQDISYAGRGAGLEGERSGLFFEAVRVVRELRPRFVVLENVAALLTRGLDVVLGTLAEVGYDAEWHCIQAADVGAPHIRDRVFVVAYAESMGRHAGRRVEENEGRKRQRRRESGGSDQVVADAAGQRTTTTQQQGQIRSVELCGENVAVAAGNGREQGDANEGGRGEKSRAEQGAGLGCGGGWWAIEPDVGRVAYGVSGRVDRLRGLGNAVVPQVAEWVGRRIMATVEP